MKIRDIINEAFGDRRVRDPYGADYEKDPETGEYTGRTETNPRSFTNMLSGVASRLGADSGSQWINVPDEKQQEKIKRYKVPPGRVLVTQTRDGRTYYKNTAKSTAKDKTGFWTDSNGNTIVDPESIKALEKLAQENSQLMFDPKTTSAGGATPDQQADTDEPVGEPSVSEPLHPDVSIVQSVPLVIQYKGKRFEMDDFGDFHPFGTNRAVTPALQAFLTKERGKL